MKIINKIIISFFFVTVIGCSKTDENVTPDSSTSKLEVNSWSFDGAVSKLSAYGFGWASTDFSPRAGWSDYTTTKDVSSIEISVLSKPVSEGKYTVELYSDIHLNKNRTTKITGNKVGITAMLGGVIYQSIASAGTMDITVANAKTKLVFKDVILKDANSDKTIKTSGNLEYNN